MSKLSDFLSIERGRASRVAKELGIAAAYLSQMASGARPIPPEMVPAIERITGGTVRRWDARPVDWHRIWPELVDTEGAPAVGVIASERSPEAACAGSIQCARATPRSAARRVIATHG